MPRSRPIFAIALITMAALTTAAYADDKDQADYREAVMTVLGEQSGALGQILSTVIPSDNAAAHIAELSMAASIALDAFQPKAPGGEAKPEIWANWSDFSQRMTDFAKAMDKTAQTAKAQGADAAMTDILTPLGGCKNCHDTYRTEKVKDPQSQ